MGQEQSATTGENTARDRQEPNEPVSDEAPDTHGGFQPGTDSGVEIVEVTGGAYRHEDGDISAAKGLLGQSAELPLPQLLIPPNSEENLSAALHGTQMMHEIRSLLSNLLINTDSFPSSTSLSATQDSDSLGINRNRSVQPSQSRLPQEPANSRSLVSSGQVVERSPLSETRSPTTMRADVIDKVINECTGGAHMKKIVDTQKRLLSQIRHVADLVSRLESSVATNIDSAKKASKATDKLDRLSMSISDVLDSLENVVATANILGASHFSHDEEMCSFKNFLKCNPPKY